MKIINIKEVPMKKVTMEDMKNTFKQVPISKKDGAPLFCFRVFTIKPGGHTPYHKHPFEHVNYIIKGHGYLKDKNGKKRPLEKGDFALVQPNEYHQYGNLSKRTDFVIICAVNKKYE